MRPRWQDRVWRDKQKRREPEEASSGWADPMPDGDAPAGNPLSALVGLAFLFLAGYGLYKLVTGG